MANRIERRQFLKAGVASTLALAIYPSQAFAADQAQKFRIGMAATTWLSADPSIANLLEGDGRYRRAQHRRNRGRQQQSEFRFRPMPTR